MQVDLEGIVAKPKLSPYRRLDGKPPWVKVKNGRYSQAEGRRELFTKWRGESSAAPTREMFSVALIRAASSCALIAIVFCRVCSNSWDTHASRPPGRTSTSTTPRS